MAKLKSPMTDPHSPGKFRANGILHNFDPWYEEFAVGKEQALYLPKEERIRKLVKAF